MQFIWQKEERDFPFPPLSDSVCFYQRASWEAREGYFQALLCHNTTEQFTLWQRLRTKKLYLDFELSVNTERVYFIKGQAAGFGKAHNKKKLHKDFSFIFVINAWSILEPILRTVFSCLFIEMMFTLEIPLGHTFKCPLVCQADREAAENGWRYEDFSLVQCSSSFPAI